mmetsp:Transcript_41019/g.116160  ORF Transcript_41019/g.116160 Transcript_41019/m.116160 type:complete len:359 (-) Transcript_41019:72-1148(-)
MPQGGRARQRLCCGVRPLVLALASTAAALPVLLVLFPAASSVHLRASEIAPEGVWQQYREDADKDWCANTPAGTGKLGYFDWGYEYFSWHALLPPVVRTLQKHQLPAGPEVQELMANGSMYLFGVAQGESLAALHGKFKSRRSFGFDSFKGLPEETDERSRAGNWGAGSFRPRATIEQVIKQGGGPNLTTVIPGFFNDTLTTELVSKANMGPAFYVDIDCDLYVSTYPALDFLFANKIARVGTVIGYDDWWTVACRLFHGRDKAKAEMLQTNYISPLSVGEGLAHSQIAKKYGVSFRCVAGSCMPVKDFTYCQLHNHWAPIFVVESIDASNKTSAHGFEFTAEEEQHWLANMGVCKTT